MKVQTWFGTVKAQFWRKSENLVNDWYLVDP